MYSGALVQRHRCVEDAYFKPLCNPRSKGVRAVSIDSGLSTCRRFCSPPHSLSLPLASRRRSSMEQTVNSRRSFPRSSMNQATRIPRATWLLHVSNSWCLLRLVRNARYTFVNLLSNANFGVNAFANLPSPTIHHSRFGCPPLES